MDIEKMKIALVPWLRVDTWHTTHPLDDRRFHRALKSAFDLLGTSIAFGDFREAMGQLWVVLAEIHEYRDNRSAAISALQKAKQILERGSKQSNADNLQFVGIKLKQLMAQGH